ncbi:MAG TPA: hypothetical protein VGB50_08970 [Flavobacterium sp.]
METNENISGKGNLGDTKWSGLQQKRHINEELNEGFCDDNLSADYNPSDAKELQQETDVDENGNPIQVDRARFPDETPQLDAPHPATGDDNRIIENRESLQNRDRNYDLDPNRYPPDDPENKRSRGNIDFGK